MVEISLGRDIKKLRYHFICVLPTVSGGSMNVKNVNGHGMFLFSKKRLLTVIKSMDDSGISFWTFIILLFAAEFIMLLWMVILIY